MKIFSGEQPQITKIYNIMMYYSDKEANGGRFVEYNGNLYSYELIYYFSGENLTNFNGKQLINTENTISCLPKGISNAKYSVERKVHGHCIDIYFDATAPLPREAFSMLVKDIRVRRLFEQSERLWHIRKVGCYARCMSTLYEIIAILQETSEYEYTPAKQLGKIDKSIKYMEKNCFHQDFSYQAFAEASALSYSYFKRLFICKYGVSPSKYINNLKIEHAIELLITRRFTITQIAEMTGFENVYYFSTFFKKETGVSPKMYMQDMVN